MPPLGCLKHHPYNFYQSISTNDRELIGQPVYSFMRPGPLFIYDLGTVHPMNSVVIHADYN